MSPSDLKRKKAAIFRHESQKDTALFPGPDDPREFWQRAEDRNRHTADLYNQIGLPEYYAMEAFVRWKGEHIVGGTRRPPSAFVLSVAATRGADSANLPFVAFAPRNCAGRRPAECSCEPRQSASVGIHERWAFGPLSRSRTLPQSVSPFL